MDGISAIEVDDTDSFMLAGDCNGFAQVWDVSQVRVIDDVAQSCLEFWPSKRSTRPRCNSPRWLGRTTLCCDLASKDLAMHACGLCLSSTIWRYEEALSGGTRAGVFGI